MLYTLNKYFFYFSQENYMIKFSLVETVNDDKMQFIEWCFYYDVSAGPNLPSSGFLKKYYKENYEINQFKLDTFYD